MTNVEQTTAPKARGSLPRKPATTFNPLGSDKVLKADDAAIVAAYREAVSKMDMGDKPFDLTDEQILVTVRSVPGPTTDELEGKRLQALLKVTGVEHDVPPVDVSSANEVAEREASEAKDAAKFPQEALETLRKFTGGREFSNIAALVLRQNLLDSPDYGKDWMRNFERIGYYKGKAGADGRQFNSAEYYSVKKPDAKGDTRTKWVSSVAGVWNKTEDGKAQQMHIAQLMLANSSKDEDAQSSPYYKLGRKDRDDKLKLWRQRNNLSIKALRDAIHIEQIMQDLETAAPNIGIEIKYKLDKDGNQTTELRNSVTPIQVYEKDKVGSLEEFKVSDFLRFKPYTVNLPEKQKDKGPNVTQLKETQARKTKPKSGQGAVPITTDESIIAGHKVLINAKQAMDLITVTLANYFDDGETEEDNRSYLKRYGDLQGMLKPQHAADLVLAYGKVVKQMQELFQPYSHRYSILTENEAVARARKEEAEHKARSAA